MQPLKSEGESQAHNWLELKAELQALRGGIAHFQTWMAAGLLEQPIETQAVQDLGPYQLLRFVSQLAAGQTPEAHMGELILSQSGKCTLIF